MTPFGVVLPKSGAKCTHPIFPCFKCCTFHSLQQSPFHSSDYYIAEMARRHCVYKKIENWDPKFDCCLFRQLNNSLRASAMCILEVLRLKCKISAFLIGWYKFEFTCFQPREYYNLVYLKISHNTSLSNFLLRYNISFRNAKSWFKNCGVE